MNLTKRELVKHVKRMQKGSKEDFVKIYDAFKNHTYFVVQKSYSDKNEIDDIVQEVFVNVYTSVSQLKKPEAFVMWFNRILSGTIVKAYRKKARDFVQDGEFFADIPEENEYLLPESNFASKESRAQVMEAIDKLPARQKQVIIAHYYQQMKVKDIAEVHELSVGAIKNSLHNARESLKKTLAPAVSANSFALPLGYILRAEFETFTVPASAYLVGQSIAEGLGAAASASINAAAPVGALGSLTGTAAAVCITAGIVVGSISVAPHVIDIINPPEPCPYEQQGEAPAAGCPLADWMGSAADAALLQELTDADDAERENELQDLFNRHGIHSTFRSGATDGTLWAYRYELEREGKRLQIIRLNGARYLVEFHFGYAHEPGHFTNEMIDARVIRYQSDLQNRRG